MDIPLSEEHKKGLSVDQLAKLIFRLEKENRIWIKNGQDLLNTLSPPPESQTNSPIDRRNDKEFCLKFYEAIAYLKRRQLLMDVAEHQGPTHPLEPGLRITSVWERASLDDAGIIMLIDTPQEIVNSLKKKIPLNDVVGKYYLESIQAWQEELYIASTICLGAASEKAIHCLADAVIKYNPTIYEKKINKSRRTISGLITYLSDNAETFFSFEDGRFIYDLKEKLDLTAHIYRLNRNKVGHPPESIPDIQRDTQEAFLRAFHYYCETIFKAIELLDHRTEQLNSQ